MSATPDDEVKALLQVRPGVGMAARVVQRSNLRFSRIVVDRPALILLRQGTKILESAGRRWIVQAGEAVAIAGGHIFDVANHLSDRGIFEARWLVWDRSIIARFDHPAASRPAADATALGRLGPQMTAAFDRALEAIAEVRDIPDDVAQHRLAEVLVWLSRRGVRFAAAESPSVTTTVRRLIETAPAAPWTVAAVAGHLALSEATLRRRLAAEGATFGGLLADMRMSLAMLLLQSTDQPVNRIALEVGYESPSRFAVRFRSRFGFPPTAVRGQARGPAGACPSSPPAP